MLVANGELGASEGSKVADIRKESGLCGPSGKWAALMRSGSLQRQILIVATSDTKDTVAARWSLFRLLLTKARYGSGASADGQSLRPTVLKIGFPSS